MAGTILDEPYQVFAFAENFQNGFYNLKVRFLVVTADIIYLAEPAFFKDKVNSLAVVFNIKPVADVFALAVNGKLLSLKRIRNYLWNELFREMIWTVVV